MTLHGSERNPYFGTRITSSLEEIWHPVFGPASNLAVVHEIILGGVAMGTQQHILRYDGKFERQDNGKKLERIRVGCGKDPL